MWNVCGKERFKKQKYLYVDKPQMRRYYHSVVSIVYLMFRSPSNFI